MTGPTAANAVMETLVDTIQTAVKKGDAVHLWDA
jgi:nucleoid DNA-binding protein